MLCCKLCRYDHLSECLSRILDERPNDVLGNLNVNTVEQTCHVSAWQLPCCSQEITVHWVNYARHGYLMQGTFLFNPFATGTFEQLSLTVKAEKFVQTSDTLQVGWMCMCVVVQALSPSQRYSYRHSEGVSVTNVLLVVTSHPQPWDQDIFALFSTLHCIILAIHL